MFRTCAGRLNLSKKFLKSTEQNQDVPRYIGKPRYDSGRTHPFHPECARLNLRRVSIPHYRTLQLLRLLWYSSAADER
jgi:hypothetical protein